MESDMNMLIDCPSCGSSVKVQTNVKLGEIFVCDSCSTDLEVVWLDPIELDVVYEPDDDDFFDDDYDYDEDDSDYDDLD
jgi:alpha-aminoadipate carrier protein LysW